MAGESEAANTGGVQPAQALAEEAQAAQALADEGAVIDSRRVAIDGRARPGRWGLALSGGGIRSATFALGVLQAVAERRVRPPCRKSPQADGTASEAGGASSESDGAAFRASLLSLFDIVSTVSGGGYVGAFFCSLFQPGRLRGPSKTPAAAADDAVAVLAGGAPGRIRSHAYRDDAAAGGSDDIRRAPLSWLRENGRYLTPTGMGDAVYAAALGIRGWIALHVVVGSALLAALAALGTLRGWGWLADIDAWALTQALSGPAAAAKTTTLLSSPEVDVALRAVTAAAHAPATGFWWSATLALAALPLAVALAAGTAFWLTSMKGDGSSGCFNWASLGMLAAAVVLGAASCAVAHWSALAAAWDKADWRAVAAAFWWEPESAWAAAPALAWVMAALSLGALSGTVYHAGYAFVHPPAAEQRAGLTRHLAWALACTLAALGLGLVETMGQTAYLWLLRQRPGATAVTPAAAVAAVVWLVRQLSKRGGAAGKPGWVSKLPLTTLAGAAGAAIFSAIAVAWSLGYTALAWGGGEPLAASLGSADRLAVLSAWTLMLALLAVLIGRFPGFINLSSLQSFYAARLTRAWLGASNGSRFRSSAADNPKARTAAEPIDGDNLELRDFWHEVGGRPRLTTWAPLHIVNVTVNKTVDPADQLVQRDRKGQPLAVLPWSYAIDGRPRPYTAVDADAPEIKRPLSLGQWIGTSGAAFSTGIGRETSLGMSLLMGAANVRLGTWWESGRPPQAPGRSGLSRAAEALFKTQTYLSYEFRARFHGRDRQWQYLSDGGHFENTALYELLRPGRGVEVIVACDDGADPDYRFDDLANLVRLARIDLGVDVEVVDARAEGLAFDRGGPARPVFGRTDDFRPAALARAAGKPNPLALLLRARSCKSGDVTAWIVLVKPAWHDDAPADVAQYSLAHPAFPQEPTTDQFFDEAQWESYRQLGHFIARQVLAERVFDALLDRIARRPHRRRCAGGCG